MDNNLRLLTFILLFFSLKSHAIRSLYVDDFDQILGDTIAENTLLNYAQSNNIQSLLLYNLHLVHATHNLTNSATNYVLANFIKKAKLNYGVLSIGATAENGAYFTNVIDVYNNTRSDALEKFDAYNLEFEFWNSATTNLGGYYCNNYLIPNGLPCTNNGAFQFFLSSLQTMDSLATNNTAIIKTEAYVGWPTAGQADTISKNLDRLLLHAYVSTPNTAFSYAQDRLIDFANGTNGLEVSIIFSAEPNFMKNWLENNSMLAAEQRFTNDWMTTSMGWGNNINLQGFTYFTYSEMSAISLPLHVQKKTTEQTVTIHPTLVASTLSINAKEGITTIELFNLNGKRLKSKVFRQERNVVLNLMDLMPGLYILKVKCGLKVETLKFIKVE